MDDDDDRHRTMILQPISLMISAFLVVASIKTKYVEALSSGLPNKQMHVAGSRLRPIPYIATTSTVEHGRALEQYIREGDCVLELGTQLDASSNIILETVGKSGRAALVDVKRTETNSGRTTQGSRNTDKFLGANDVDGSKNFEYLELEQFSQWRSVLDDDHHSYRQFDILVLDATAMLGNDLELTSISVITEYVNTMVRKGRRPRAVIVKSKAIASLARRLIHAQRLFDGTIVRDLTVPSRDGKPYIVAGVGVEEYRRTIPHVVKEGDKAVEVGCFKGTTTALVHEAANPAKGGYCIGVDIGPKIIQRAKQDHPDLKFEVGDGFRSLDLMRIKQACYPQSSPREILSTYDVVYADIGGLSGPDGLMEALSLMDGLGYALEPRCIVIKSLCMRRFASSLRSYSAIWEAKTKQASEKQ